MEPERELLVDGVFLPLSQIPRAWLEAELVRRLDQIHEMHAQREQVRSGVQRVLKELDLIASDITLARKLRLTGLDRVLALARESETVQ